MVERNSLHTQSAEIRPIELKVCGMVSTITRGKEQENEDHILQGMEQLTELLASNPEAIAVLKAMQSNQNRVLEEGVEQKISTPIENA